MAATLNVACIYQTLAHEVYMSQVPSGLHSADLRPTHKFVCHKSSLVEIWLSKFRPLFRAGSCLLLHQPRFHRGASLWQQQLHSQPRPPPQPSLLVPHSVQRDQPVPALRADAVRDNEPHRPAAQPEQQRELHHLRAGETAGKSQLFKVLGFLKP